MKKKVLILNKFYVPGYKAGGPIRSIDHIVKALHDFYDFYIVTTDRDAGDLTAYDGIHQNTWNAVGKAKVYYLSPDKTNYSGIKSVIDSTSFDVLYLNSFFDHLFSILPLFLIKMNSGFKGEIVVAPRGEFSQGALEIKKYKKSLYIFISKLAGLYKGVTWQASSEFEKNDIQKVFDLNTTRIKIAPNIPAPYSEDFENWERPYDGILKLVFISRVSRKKNLHYALQVLASYKGDIEFNVYGNLGDMNYWQYCGKIIQNLPPNIKVNYRGTIPHHMVYETLRNHHIFFLPTRGENYGHAIVEAFLAGIPVLIANTTPWRNLEKSGVGWDVPLDNQAYFLEVLEHYHLALQKNQQIKSSYIIKWINQKLNIKHVVEMNKELFNS